MAKRLVCWLGMTDIKCSTGEYKGLGPIGKALSSGAYEHAHILADYPKEAVASYRAWADGLSDTKLHIHTAKLDSPMEFNDVYQAAVKVVRTVKHTDPSVELTYHVSPGTSVMAAVWIILAGSTHPATLINSSIEKGIEELKVPLYIASDYVPELLAKANAADQGITELAGAKPMVGAAFEQILHQSPEMKRLVRQSAQVAPRSLPVLLQGESGTGKELFATAIHGASGRKGKLVAVNCGAIPANLVEAELFGYAKGAFTGAANNHVGYIEESSGGTLFLDEIGEMPLHVQVKLLRVLQEKQVVRVGETGPRPVDLRVVSATNRDLHQEVLEERFREDLYHRLAVIIFQIPPLRDRTGDVSLLVAHILANANAEFAKEPGFTPKKLSANALQQLLSHPWPGNYRELNNVILRCMFWASGETIDVRDVRDAMLPSSTNQSILDRPIIDGFDLQEVLDEVERHYLERAWEQAGGKKTRASKLLGFNSYQTMDKHRARLGMID